MFGYCSEELKGMSCIQSGVAGARRQLKLSHELGACAPNIYLDIGSKQRFLAAGALSFHDDWIGYSPRMADAPCNIGDVFADRAPHLLRQQIFLGKLFPRSHGTVVYVDDVAPEGAHS
jgi:hypothetical protein